MVNPQSHQILLRSNFPAQVQGRRTRQQGIHPGWEDRAPGAPSPGKPPQENVQGEPCKGETQERGALCGNHSRNQNKGPVDSLAEDLPIYTQGKASERRGLRGLPWEQFPAFYRAGLSELQLVQGPLRAGSTEQAVETQEGSIFAGKASWAPNQGSYRSSLQKLKHKPPNINLTCK